MLSCFGSRCWISTKAIPVSLGRASRSSVNASRPPAEAPTPTMGNPSGRGSGISTGASAAGAARPAEVLKPSATDFLLIVLELRTFPRTWLVDFDLPTGRLMVFLGIHPQIRCLCQRGNKKVFHTIPLFPTQVKPGGRPLKGSLFRSPGPRL